MRAALRRRWPSTTSPSLRTRHGILKPNSRIEAHMRSTAASFFLGFLGYSRNRSIGHSSMLCAAGCSITPLNISSAFQSSTVKWRTLQSSETLGGRASCIADWRVGGRLYRECFVVSRIARQQQLCPDGYHGYHSREPQGLTVGFNAYHIGPMATTNATVWEVDSIWTPRRHSLVSETTLSL